MQTKEKVSYPRLTPTPGSNPCENGCSSLEHVLACGHSIMATGPDEVCGPNCWAMAHSPEHSKEERAAGVTFWCNACIEEEIEEDIKGQDISAQEAEFCRAELRKIFSTMYRAKQSQARKTYIGEKRVTLLVDEDDRPPRGYKAPLPKHPFEVGTLHAGRSFFEDLDLSPPDEETGIELRRPLPIPQARAYSSAHITAGHSNKPIAMSVIDEDEEEVVAHPTTAPSGTRRKASRSSRKYLSRHAKETL